MQEVMESFDKNATQELVKPPKGKKVIASKWIFKTKDGIIGVEKAIYKTQLIAKRFNQIKGIDFNDVFSHVVKYSSIHGLLFTTSVATHSGVEAIRC